MRRLNRGLFQVAMSKSRVALENEEVATGEKTEPTEATAVSATDNVEVTVKLETPEGATVEKTETAVEVPAVASDVTPAVAEVKPEAAVEPTTTEVAQSDADKIKALEAEIARLKAGAVVTEDNTPDVVAEPAVTPTTEPAVDAAPEVPAEETKTEATVTEGETAVVKDAGGEVVATIETTETGTTVVTGETKVEVTQTEDKVAVDVTVVATESATISAEDMIVIETDGETAEVEISDAVDVAEDTAELIEECDDAEEAAMTLESFAEIASSAASNGGLDSHSARLLKVATEHIYSHMGMGKALGIPSMESFEIPGARISATAIALEDIREQAKKIWAAIVEGIKKAVEWVKEFISKILSANARIASRAEKLQAAAAKMSGAPKTKVVGNGALVKSLVLGGKIPSDLAGETKKVVDFFFNSMGERTTGTIVKSIDTIRQIKNTTDAEKVEAMVFDAIKSVTGGSLQYNNVSASVAAKVGVSEPPAGTSISMSPRFPGEQVVWAYIPSTVDTISSFRTGIGIDSSKDRIDDKTMVITLTPAQISNVSKVALSYVAVSEKYKELQKSLEEITKVIATFMSAASAGQGIDNGAPFFKTVGSAMKAIRHLMKGIHQPAAVVASRVVNASLNLAMESAKQYSA